MRASNVIPLHPEDRDPFDDRLGEFREYLIGEGFAPRTIAIKMQYARRAAIWLGENRGVSLDDASALDVADYAETVPRHRSTRAHVRGALRDWWAFVERVRPPVKAIRLPKKSRSVTKALGDPEITRMIEAAKGDHPAGTAVMFGYYLALRSSEIATARWDGFDSSRRWYTVHGAKGGGLASLPVHPDLRAQLDLAGGEDPWIFPGSRGRDYVTTASIVNWVQLIADRADVEGMHPHRLRHTSLARANDILGDLRAVSEFARHARVETTMGYTRTTAQKLEAVSETLGL